MHLTLTLAALVAMAPDFRQQADFTHFTSYTKAHHAAEELGKPMLVILNPPAESDRERILIEEVRKTRQRRELLESYVVVVLDTGTPHGQVCYDLFKQPDLPRVVVIDREQKYQIFQTSEELYGQLWTTILETYQKGERLAARPVTHQSPSAGLPSGFPAQAGYGAPISGYRPASTMPTPGYYLQQQQFCAT